VSALLFSGFLSSLFLLVGNLKSLIMFQGVVEWSWYLVSPCFWTVYLLQFTVLGVLILRKREPNLKRSAFTAMRVISDRNRPYKVITMAPIVFSSVAGLLVFRGLASAPLQAALAALFTMACILLYYLARRDGALLRIWIELH
jgi:hypothetical protein